MTSGAAIRSARAAAGLTQQQLAARAGTSQPTLSAYESGRKQPSVETLERVLAAAGARLSVEAAERAVVRVPQQQLEHRGRVLAEVLALAEALPSRRRPRLGYPRLEPRPQ